MRPIKYNYRTKEEMVSRGEPYHKLKDLPGFSVFKLEDAKMPRSAVPVRHTAAAWRE
jgi:hypothetical protein